MSSQAEYRRTLSKFPTGVAVVTALTGAGDPIGLTVSSFVSISLEPAIVSWSLRLKSSLYQYFVEAGSFVVNVLAAEQSDLATQFATRSEDRFEGISWSSGLSGNPILMGAAATFECEEVSSLVMGDHMVFFGEVVAFSGADREPLIMHSGAVMNGTGGQKPAKDVAINSVAAPEMQSLGVVERGVGCALIF